MAFLIQFVRKNPFVFALLIAVLLAFLIPGLGAKEGLLKTGITTKAGVMVIFFLQGLSLKTSELAKGLRDVRLHTFVQTWIFIFAGIVLGTAGFTLKISGIEELAGGFLYLALIPTTVASAVAFTSASNGNVAAALFNTTLANVFAVLWVPAWCLVLFSSGAGMQAELLAPLLLKLFWLIILPLALGQLLRPQVASRSWFPSLSPHFKSINHGIILFIVFVTFSQSVLSNVWSGVSGSSLGIMLIVTIACLLIIHTGVWISSGWFLKSIADRRAALFCASQKTLAAGTPMAVAIFADGEAMKGTNVSLILLPLLCYHPLQLLLAALILPKISD